MQQQKEQKDGQQHQCQEKKHDYNADVINSLTWFSPLNVGHSMQYFCKEDDNVQREKPEMTFFTPSRRRFKSGRHVPTDQLPPDNFETPLGRATYMGRDTKEEQKEKMKQDNSSVDVMQDSCISSSSSKSD